MKLDHSVYPDLEAPPHDLPTSADKSDYVHRICGQWDYGIVPEPETFALFADWREVFDAFPIDHSPAYHTFRSWFGWPRVPGRLLRANYEIYDLQEGRSDPCVDWI